MHKALFLILACVAGIPLLVALWWTIKWHLPAESASYDVLQTLLDSEEWEKADKETSRIILLKASKHNLFRATRGGVSIDKFQSFPCDDLLTLDRLWINNSKQKFGFSIQAAIWQVENQPLSSDVLTRKLIHFTEKVGWGKDNAVQIDSNKTSYNGYFPSQLWINQSSPNVIGMNVYKLNALLTRTKECYEKAAPTE
jgi:hypothetical protein